MRPDTLLSYVRAAPFRPFRLVMNSGKVYDVRHPEMIRVGRDVAIYYHAPAPDAPFDRWESLSLLLIQNIEHLEQPARDGASSSRRLAGAAGGDPVGRSAFRFPTARPTTRHPELLRVGLGSMSVGVPPTGQDKPVYERVETVSLQHVVNCCR